MFMLNFVFLVKNFRKQYQISSKIFENNAKFLISRPKLFTNNTKFRFSRPKIFINDWNSLKNPTEFSFFCDFDTGVFLTDARQNRRV